MGSRGDDGEARRVIQADIPVFSRPEAEAYPKHKLATLLADIDKHTGYNSK